MKKEPETRQPPDRPAVWEYLSRSPSETRRLGRRLGQACRGGEILLLDGPLGAGKTLLAGGIAEGLGIARTVNSPTFVIMRSYKGDRGLTLHHLDFYRLGGDADLETVGLEDCFTPDAVMVVEWPGICPGAFDAFTLTLQLEFVDETTRRLRAVAGDLPHNFLNIHE